MKKGRISIRVHPAGWMVLLAALLFLPSHLVLGAALALLWHEVAHVAAMLACGIRQCTVEMTPFGGMADAKSFEQLHPLRQMICAGAGIAASVAGAWSCMAVLPHTVFVGSLLRVHWSLALVNCLPAWPLDGARVLTALAACFGRENAMRKCLSICSQWLGGCMVLLSLYGAWRGYMNPSMLLAGPYLWYAAMQGNTADRLRRICRCEEKLKNGAVLPVQALICQRHDIKPLVPVLIGRWEQQRCQLLVQMDEKGSIRRVWTEKEMLDTAMEGIDTGKKVDKARHL